MEVLSPCELKDRINATMIELFEVQKEDLAPEAHLFNDLGLDSLDAIDMVIAFQSKFKIKPDNSELQAIRTVQDVYDLVAKYYDKNNPH